MTRSEVEALTRGVIAGMRGYVDGEIAKAADVLRSENTALQRRVGALEALLSRKGGA